MIKRVNIELKPEQINDSDLIKHIAAREAGIAYDQVSAVEYIKRSLDSRNKKQRYSLQLDVYQDENPSTAVTVKSLYKECTSNNISDKSTKSVIIIGAGPAGYFSALELLEFGIKPIIFDRGKNVDDRRADLKNLLDSGSVNPNSNYCFGEGGAGAYSDGKLYTRSDKRGNIHKALKIFVEHGADPDILVDAHPHIGSDKLPKIIAEIRKTILEFGGEVHFDSFVSDIIIENDSAKGVIINNCDEFRADAVILASGHSASDIYYLLNKKDIHIDCKNFAVGFRVEHFQELINQIQYGENYYKELPPASYKLVSQTESGGVFSFCMCPGGIIVPASTAPNELVVNGMSMSKRNSEFANAGIVTSVSEKDFIDFSEFGALAGLKFRENLEAKFYTGNKENPLKAPAQRLIDFIGGKKSSSLHDSSYIPGLVISDLYKMFPKVIGNRLQNGCRDFGHKMKGFFTLEANVIGLESRTSSPVRITRDRETYEHIQISGLYPCGEGSGYAGGIISSALDGQNSARKLAEKLLENQY
jgi:uncharacterized protein